MTNSQAQNLVSMLPRRSSIDIVTPVYGSPDLLLRLVETIFSFDTGLDVNDWRWWVIDDKGPESDKLSEVYKKIKSHPCSKVIPPTKNRGFAGANNEAVRQGIAPYVLLLNSDIMIAHDNWLTELLKELENPSVGAVGAKLIYFEDTHDMARPAGTTQHAGVAFNLLGQPYHIFKGWGRNHPKVHQRREMNCVTGACLATKRHLYFEMGGLDEEYGQGNFEDVQYCLQLRQAKYKVIYTPEVCLYHFAGGSNNNAQARYNETLFQIKIGRKYAPYDEWLYY